MAAFVIRKMRWGLVGGLEMWFFKGSSALHVFRHFEM